jgi:hypothetical protein
VHYTIRVELQYLQSAESQVFQVPRPQLPSAGEGVSAYQYDRICLVDCLVECEGKIGGPDTFCSQVEVCGKKLKD